MKSPDLEMAARTLTSYEQLSHLWIRKCAVAMLRVIGFDVNELRAIRVYFNQQGLPCLGPCPSSLAKEKNIVIKY